VSTFPSIPPVCRHCNDPAKRVNRPKGLCWTCYHLPGVRERFGTLSKYGRRGVGNGTGGRSLPVAATKALPGTSAKVGVLEERAKAGRALWHPDDATPQPVSRRKHSPHYRKAG
jgi:hypothetical protein